MANGELLGRVLDVFNDYLTEKRLRFVVELPEGTQEATLYGTGSPVLDFFMLSAAVRPVFVAVIDELGGVENVDAEMVLDELWTMIRADCMDQLLGGGEPDEADADPEEGV